MGDMATGCPRASSGGYAVVVMLHLSTGLDTDLTKQVRAVMHQLHLMILDLYPPHKVSKPRYQDCKADHGGS
jgi:hypothetical protein